MSTSELLTGAILFLGFVVGLFILSKLVPGRSLEGAPLADKSRITYRLNGFPIFVLVAAATFASIFLLRQSFAILIHNFWGLFVAANVFSLAVTVLLYFQGRKRLDVSDEDVRVGSRSDNPAASVALPSATSVVKDMFMGVELNPRWFGVDLKMFSYRPSLIGLFMLNVGFACLQLERHGALSQAMILYQVFTFVYVLNYFQFEYGMLYTWDIMSENFGWMLVWGDYAFVPFAYSVIGWYLVDHTAPLPLAALILLPCLFVLGLWLFRGSNQQKERFKRDPNAKIWGRTPETLGGRILVSGFWGIGRKLNYTGEICVYFSWALLSGFQSVVPYILPTWLLCLLTHRAWRDERRCREKYGALWDEYCKRARFRMFPFLY